MSARKLQRLLVFALLAIGATLLGIDLLSGGGKAVPAKLAHDQNSYPFVRAAGPIARGAVIRPQDIQIVLATVQPAAGAIMQITDAVGRIAIREIASSESVTISNTTIAQNDTGLAQLVPAGLRAVAVGVTDELSVANLIRPGDHVDLFVVSNATRAARGEETPFPKAEVRTVLEDIRVLAVGETIIGTAPSSKSYRNVTLAVTPKQAGMIALSRTVGTQYLSLRGAGDASRSHDAWALTTDDLHFDATDLDEASAKPAAGTPHTVEIISGGGGQRATALVPQAGVP